MQIAIELKNISMIHPYLAALTAVIILITVTTFVLVGKELKSHEKNS